MRRGPGETLRLVAKAFKEDPDLSDEALGAALGITGAAVRAHRGRLGIPTAWARRAVGSEAHRAVYCEPCARHAIIQIGRVTIICRGCGSRLRRTP